MTEAAAAAGGGEGDGSAAAAAAANGAGAAAGNGAAGAAALANGSGPVNYFNGLDPETSGWLQNKAYFGQDLSKVDAVTLAKGFQSWAKSDRNLESIVGRNRLAVPKDPADHEAYTALYKALGHPADKAGYEITLPEGGNQAYQDAMLEVFHKEGVSVRQAQAIAKISNELVTAAAAEREAQFATQSAADLTAVKKEWGQESDSNFAAAQRARVQFGIEQPMLEKIERAIGTKDMLGLLSKIGHGLTEDRGAGAGGSSAVPAGTPEAAQAKLNELKNDKDWVKAFQAGGAKENQEFQRLTRILAGA